MKKPKTFKGKRFTSGPYKDQLYSDIIQKDKEYIKYCIQNHIIWTIDED